MHIFRRLTNLSESFYFCFPQIMKTSENSGKYEIVRLFRAAIPEEMSQSYGHFPTGGGGVVAQPNSIWGCFSYITAAIPVKFPNGGLPLRLRHCDPPSPLPCFWKIC